MVFRVVVPAFVLLSASVAAAAPHGVRLTYPGDPATQIAVSWTSDSATESDIIYGTDPANLGTTVAAQESFTQAGPLTNSFSATVTGLTPNTTYYYRVGSAGNYHPPAGQDPFEFTTLTDDACDPISFVLIGDNRADFDNIGPSPLWSDILSEALAHDPDFFVNTGDMVKNGEVPEEWANFIDESETGWARVPSILTIGNHDDMDDNGPGAYYSQLYALPRNDNDWENYYSIDIGPVHFVSLDSNLSGTEFTDMVAWLDADLTANEQGIVIVFFHHAIYSRGNHSTGEDDNGLLNATLIPVFDAHKVDFVFNGHSHNYERYAPTRGVDSEFGGSGRTYPAGNGGTFGPGQVVPDGEMGTTYMVSGGAGSLTTDVFGFTCRDAACTLCTGININCPADVYQSDVDGTAVYNGDHNFAVVRIENDMIAVEVYSTDAGNEEPGEMIDSFTMANTGRTCGSDGEPDAGSANPDGGGPIGPDAAGPGPGDDDGGCGCQTSGSGGGAALLLLAALYGLGRRRRS